MNTKKTAELVLEQGDGIMRLAPNWVPRSFCVPGRRLKLHPDDYYALGGERGGIDERWFSSTTPADNGPKTSPDEGMSFIVFQDGGRESRILFRDAIHELKGNIIGERIWKKYGRWPMYSKFFDNQGALPHHVHHREKHARLVGQSSKHEAYYFPSQLNNHGGDFPYTFFGIEQGTSKEQIKQCLKNFTKGDNKITNLSRAYRLETGTGWDVPPGVLHAPGSLCTYEPQEASDVFAMYQSLVGDQIIPEELLWKNTPANKVGNHDYLVEVLDWDKNVDTAFAANRFMRPKPIQPEKEMIKAGYIEKWICYRSKAFSASELTVLPGKTVTIANKAAYGLIVLEGFGKMGVWNVETPALIRYGQLTNDEFFVSESAARRGVTIRNFSATVPIVMLKHFGPDNPELTLLERK